MRVPRLQTKPTHSATGNESPLRNGRCGNRFWSRFLPHRNLCSFPHRARNPKPVCTLCGSRRFRCAQSRPRPRTRPDPLTQISRGNAAPAAKTNAFALARPPILSAPCMPPVHSPAANRPGTPHEPCSSIAMPPFEACAYGAMHAGALAETPHSRSSHPENVRTNSGEPSPTSHAISMPSSPHASMAKSSGAPARSHENGPCSLRASRTSRAIGSPDASQARANRNAFSLNTMLRRGATSPGMTCMNSKFTKRAPQRAAIAWFVGIARNRKAARSPSPPPPTSCCDTACGVVEQVEGTARRALIRHHPAVMLARTRQKRTTPPSKPAETALHRITFKATPHTQRMVEAGNVLRLIGIRRSLQRNAHRFKRGDSLGNAPHERVDERRIGSAATDVQNRLDPLSSISDVARPDKPRPRLDGKLEPEKTPAALARHTEAPARAASIAAQHPAMPPPTTTTSNDDSDSIYTIPS